MLPALAEKARRWLLDFFGQRWVRFGIVGALSTAIYVALGIGCEWLHIPVLLGNAIAYVLSFVFSYLAQRSWTFRSQLPHAQLLPKYAALQAGGLGLNTCIIALLMHFGLPYIFAMGVAVVLVPFVVYILNKIWVFRTPESDASPEKSL